MHINLSLSLSLSLPSSLEWCCGLLLGWRPGTGIIYNRVAALMQLAPHCPMFYSWPFIIRAPLKKVRPHLGQARPPCLTYPSAWQERLPQEVFQKTSNSGTIDSFARSTWILAYIFPESLRKRQRKRRQQRGESVRESESAHGIMKS